MVNTQYETREAWLREAIESLRPRFTEVGHPLPDKVRASVGWPGGGSKHNRIGECWHPEASTGGWTEIFISPVNAKALAILETVIHEGGHAAAGCGVGHKKPWQNIVVAVGLEYHKKGQTSLGPSALEWSQAFIAEHGEFPHDEMVLTGRKKQTTRLLKAECRDCWAIVRITRRVIESPGLPTCACGGPFELA